MAKSPAAPPVSHRCRILCVDDEPAIRDVVRSLLQREGHEVDVAPDGAEAWEKISKDPRDVVVVITDNNMPNLSGMELVARLRTTDFAGKIIMFSSSLTPDDRAKLEDYGVDAVVEKGSPVAELIGAVRKATQF